MKPSKSILDGSFVYTSSTATAVDATWRKHGWQPMTQQERNSRHRQVSAANDGRVVELKAVRSA